MNSNTTLICSKDNSNSCVKQNIKNVVKTAINMLKNNTEIYTDNFDKFFDGFISSYVTIYCSKPISRNISIYLKNWLLLIFSQYKKINYTPKLSGNSANAKFTEVEVINQNDEIERLFMKFQLSENVDNMVIDNINGYIINEIFKSNNNNFMTYIDSSKIDLIKDGNEIDFNILKNPYDNNNTFGGYRCSIHKLIETPLSLEDRIYDAISYKDIDTDLKLIEKLFSEIKYLGNNYGFTHNDAHIGNILYTNKNREEKYVLIDYGRVFFNENLFDNNLKELIKNKINIEFIKNYPYSDFVINNVLNNLSYDNPTLESYLCNGNDLNKLINSPKPYEHVLRNFPNIYNTMFRHYFIMDELLKNKYKELTKYLYLFDIMKIGMNIIDILCTNIVEIENSLDNSINKNSNNNLSNNSVNTQHMQDVHAFLSDTIKKLSKYIFYENKNMQFNRYTQQYELDRTLFVVHPNTIYNYIFDPNDKFNVLHPSIFIFSLVIRYLYKYYIPHKITYIPSNMYKLDMNNIHYTHFDGVNYRILTNYFQLYDIPNLEHFFDYLNEPDNFLAILEIDKLVKNINQVGGSKMKKTRSKLNLTKTAELNKVAKTKFKTFMIGKGFKKNEERTKDSPIFIDDWTSIKNQEELDKKINQMKIDINEIQEKQSETKNGGSKGIKNNKIYKK